MTFAQAVVEMEAYYQARRDTQRRGQAYYNWLWEYNQRVALDYTGSTIDPFYQDVRIPEFLATLGSLKGVWD